jgi:tRNA-specific adenosine deaminase 1
MSSADNRGTRTRPSRRKQKRRYSMNQEAANNIAAIVLSLYDSLSSNGKPKGSEFSVLAAIVMEQLNDDEVSSLEKSHGSLTAAVKRFRVISLATGTKCIGRNEDNSRGNLLADSHAEILAKRGFQRFLMKCALTWHGNQSSHANPIEYVQSTNKFQVKKGCRFHLFVSDSPCGDASIYSRRDGMDNFTGAKPIRSEAPCSSDKPIREEKQAVGILRTKAGRSTIEEKNRTTSMSCSDKICRWQCLGCQGALLANCFEEVCLASLIVGQDPLSTATNQKEALQRCFHTRMIGQAASEFNIFIVDFHGYAYGKCNQEFRFEKESMASASAKGSPIPSGTSINWLLDVADKRGVDIIEAERKRFKPSQGGSIEITQAQLGILHGSVKRCVGADDASSRLCRREMMILLQLLQQKKMMMIRENLSSTSTATAIGEQKSDLIELPNTREVISYAGLKQGSSEYTSKRNLFLLAPTFKDWICDDIIDFVLENEQNKKKR